MNLSSFKNYISFERRFSPHTVLAYEADILQALDYIQQTFEISDPNNIDHHHMRSWVVGLVTEKLGPRSINRKMSSLRTYFRFLLRSGAVKNNPATHLKALKLPKRLPVYLQEKETATMMHSEHKGNDYPNVRDRQIIRTLYVTGMRRSELMGLKIDDVDLCTKTYRVFGKGGKTRLIPFAEDHKLELQAYLDKRTATFDHVPNDLFFTDKGKKLYPKFVYNLVRRYLSNVTTLSQKGPHTLRHTFATHLANHGADLNAIKDLLGHASLSATQIYTHNSIEKLKKVYTKAHPKAES